MYDDLAQRVEYFLSTTSTPHLPKPTDARIAHESPNPPLAQHELPLGLLASPKSPSSPGESARADSPDRRHKPLPPAPDGKSIDKVSKPLSLKPHQKSSGAVRETNSQLQGFRAQRPAPPVPPVKSYSQRFNPGVPTRSGQDSLLVQLRKIPRKTSGALKFLQREESILEPQGTAVACSKSNYVEAVLSSKLPSTKLALPPRTDIRRERMEVFKIITRSIDCFDDLFCLVRTERCFYSAYKESAFEILRKVVFNMYPPVWECLEINMQRQDVAVLQRSAHMLGTLYWETYVQHIYTFGRVMACICLHCQDILRADSGDSPWAKNGRLMQLHNALWRIWSFCQIFGCDECREAEIQAQINWLNGEAMLYIVPDNKSSSSMELQWLPGCGSQGLSQSELDDMKEIWACLKFLLRPLQNACSETRDIGLFHQKGLQGGSGDEGKALGTPPSYYTFFLIDS